MAFVTFLSVYGSLSPGNAAGNNAGNGGGGRIAVTGFGAQQFGGTLGRAGTIFLQAAGTGGDLILDTTVLIDAERADGLLDSVIGDDDDVVIAAITLAELLVGVRMSTGRRRAARQSFVDGIAASIPVISYDTAVADAHADLLVAMRTAGRPRGAHDLIIAATARASGRTVVTADRTGFVELPGVTSRSY